MVQSWSRTPDCRPIDDARLEVKLFVGFLLQSFGSTASQCHQLNIPQPMLLSLQSASCKITFCSKTCSDKAISHRTCDPRKQAYAHTWFPCLSQVVVSNNAFTELFHTIRSSPMLYAFKPAPRIQISSRCRMCKRNHVDKHISYVCFISDLVHNVPALDKLLSRKTSTQWNLARIEGRLKV